MDVRTKLSDVQPDSRGPGIYATITRLARGVTVTVFRQAAKGYVYLLIDGAADSDASAVSVINAEAAASRIPADRVRIRRVAS